ncbi:MAG: hypothetical protein A4E70_00566 [Syntrophus sp. PtaU1.Bin005]|nr:MAG: hypothetical protein A4E70_00566 [Syntrophus sp. PtaU1.Bin005]
MIFHHPGFLIRDLFHHVLQTFDLLVVELQDVLLHGVRQYVTLFVHQQGIAGLTDFYPVHHIHQVGDIDHAARHTDDSLILSRENRAGGHADEIAGRFGFDHIAEVALALKGLSVVLPVRGIDSDIPSLDTVGKDKPVPPEKDDRIITVAGGLPYLAEFALSEGDFTPACLSAGLCHLFRGSHNTVGK